MGGIVPDRNAAWSRAGAREYAADTTGVGRVGPTPWFCREVGWGPVPPGALKFPRVLLCSSFIRQLKTLPCAGYLRG